MLGVAELIVLSSAASKDASFQDDVPFRRTAHGLYLASKVSERGVS
jgi:hypothetical protein